jgi:hypothetical protein
MKKRFCVLAVLVFTLCLLAACATPTQTPPVAQTIIVPQTGVVTPIPVATPTISIMATRALTAVPTVAQSLRGTAVNRKILIGAAVAPDYIRRDSQYASTLGREFNALTPENAMKFEPLRPTRRHSNSTMQIIW